MKPVNIFSKFPYYVKQQLQFWNTNALKISCHNEVNEHSNECWYWKNNCCKVDIFNY